MKICWDNLEGMRITKNGYLRRGTITYIEKDACKRCGDMYLTIKCNQSDFCGKSCAFSGRMFSEETKRKMSESGKLKRLTKEHKNKIAKSMCEENNHFYGKNHSIETRFKISKSLEGKNLGEDNHFYGKRHSYKSKKKMSKTSKGMIAGENNFWYGKGYLKVGKNNPNWKGGISCEPYCHEWSFKEFKDYIKERDGNRCLNPDCFGNIYRLNVHHIDYNKKNCEPQNLITLCTSCNARANFERKWHKSWYKAIINRRYGNGDSYNQFSL